VRTRTGVSLIAVLLALATGCGTRTAPEAAPEVAAPALPRLAGGALHVGPTTVRTGADRLVFAAGTTLVGVTTERHSQWWLLDGDRLATLLDEPAAYVVPVLSADGGTAAWVAEISSVETGEWTSHAAWEVAAYDVPTRTVLGRTALHGDVTCCDQGGMLTVVAVANDGRVGLTHGAPSSLMSWRAGDDPAPASWRDFGGRLPDGAVRSPDETMAAGPDLVVRDTRTGERTSLDLPIDHRWRVMAWEDDSHVLVARGHDDAAPEVVRCEAATGGCDPG
jgi:hypothetical protein